MALYRRAAASIVEPATPGREFVPRGVGVEKPARRRCPNDLLGTNWRQYSPSRRGFPPTIRSSPPRLVDNVTPVDDTIPARFLRTVTERQTTWRCGEKVGESDRTLTFGDYADRATRLAAALAGPRRRARRPGRDADRATGPSSTSPTWPRSSLGGTPISIYNSSSPEQIRYLAGHCRADGRDRRARRVPRSAARGPRRPPRPRATSSCIDEPLDAHRDRVVGRAARRRAASTSRPPPRRRAARRSRHRHLHVGHHRRPEGRDARPRQHLLDGRQPPARARLLAPRASGSSRTSRWRTSRSAIVSHYGGHRVRLRGHRRAPTSASSARSCRDAAAAPLRRAAHVREDPQRRARGARRPIPAERGVRPALAIGREVAEPARSGDEPPSSSPPSTSAVDAEIAAARCASCSVSTTLRVRGHRGGADPGRDPRSSSAALGVPLSEMYGLSESSGPGTWEPVRVRPGTVGRADPGHRAPPRPTTARCCCAAATSSAATSTIPSAPPRRSTPTAGCTPATSASSTTTATSGSSTARRSSSSPRAARTSRPRTSRPR